MDIFLVLFLFLVGVGVGGWGGGLGKQRLYAHPALSVLHVITDDYLESSQDCTQPYGAWIHDMVIHQHLFPAKNTAIKPAY